MTTAHPFRPEFPLLVSVTVLGVGVLATVAYVTRPTAGPNEAAQAATAPLHQVTSSQVPKGLDYGTTRTSNAGLFKMTYTPSATPVPVNTLQTWTLHLETKDGEPINDAEIKVDGDMPQHGHGLPTSPQVTRKLGRGDYLVEGVRFQMGGWWVMEFKVNAQNRTDTVRFNLMLEE